MNKNYKNYDSERLPIEDIKKFAKQYEEVDVWELIGEDENEFPFLIWNSEIDFNVMYWSKREGIIPFTYKDPVLNYAFAIWLKENAHPVFKSLEDAEKYAMDRDWPRI